MSDLALPFTEHKATRQCASVSWGGDLLVRAALLWFTSIPFYNVSYYTSAGTTVLSCSSQSFVFTYPLPLMAKTIIHLLLQDLSYRHVSIIHEHKSDGST